MKTLVISAIILLSQLAQAGSASVELKCASDSGRTQIQGYVPGDDTDFRIDFTIDGQTLTYFNEYDPTEVKNAEIAVFDEIQDKVYSVSIENNDEYNYLSLYAIPKSVKKVHVGSHSRSFEFKAKITPRSTDPRKKSEGRALEKAIVVDCSYEYSI